MSKSVLHRVVGSISNRLSPVTFVMLASALLLGSSFLIRYFTQETIDPRMKYEQDQRAETIDGRAERPSVAATYGDEDPAVRYADRLRDAAALSVAFSLYTLNERLVNKRVLPNVAIVLDGLKTASLMPPGLSVVNASGVIRSPTGLCYIRYRPRPFGVEILSVGANGLADGEVFVIRLPETTKNPTQELAPSQIAGNYAAVFVAPRSDALLPQPFAPASIYTGAGWTQEPLRASPYSQQQLDELQAWLAKYQRQISQ